MLPVLVAKGKVVEQILGRLYVFGSKHFCNVRSNAAHILRRSIQGRHNEDAIVFCGLTAVREMGKSGSGSEIRRGERL